VYIGRASLPLPIDKGATRLDLGGDRFVPLALEEGAVATEIVLKDAKTGLFFDGRRYADDSGNVRVFFVDENGNPDPSAPAQKLEGGEGTELSHDQSLNLPTETYSYGDATVEILPKYAYSFYFVKQGDTYQAHFLINADPSKPSVGNQTAG
jgi:hypothetical protein